MRRTKFSLPCQKARDSVPSQMVNPAFGSELCHAGVYPGVPRLTFLPRIE